MIIRTNCFSNCSIITVIEFFLIWYIRSLLLMIHQTFKISRGSRTMLRKSGKFKKIVLTKEMLTNKSYSVRSMIYHLAMKWIDLLSSLLMVHPKNKRWTTIKNLKEVYILPIWMKAELIEFKLLKMTRKTMRCQNLIFRIMPKKSSIFSPSMLFTTEDICERFN